MVRSSSKQSKFVKVNKSRRDKITQMLNFDRKTIVEEGIQNFLHDCLKLVAELLMNDEVIELVGERHERSDARTAHRWGSQKGSVTLLEQKVPIAKPRVRARGGGGEIELEMYKLLNDPMFLNKQAGAKLLAGLSTRNVSKTLEKILDGRGVGRQTVSRRGIEEMSKQLELFKNRSFENTDFVAVFIDGVGLGERIFVTAVGLEKSGIKRVLGFEQGSTENSGVCRKLLSNLIDRGILDEGGGHLFVIDGGKGLHKAIKSVFGNRAEIQRCIEHKKRNVQDQLPKYAHSNFTQKYAAAYSKKTLKAAEKAFADLRRDLERNGFKSAANSLLEGSSELLTLHRLGVDGSLRKSLSSTNCIESIFSTARYYTRNIKRWRKEEQMERWLAASLLTAEKSLRRVPGYTQIPKLIAALRKVAKD